MCFLDVPSLLFDEQGGKTNTVGEKINPSILIQLHKKGGNNKEGYMGDANFPTYHSSVPLEWMDRAGHLSKYCSLNLL